MLEGVSLFYYEKFYVLIFDVTQFLPQIIWFYASALFNIMVNIVNRLFVLLSNKMKIQLSSCIAVTRISPTT